MMNKMSSLLLLLLVAISFLISLSRAGLLPNGNFERAPKRSKLRGTEVMGKHAIPEWVSSGHVDFIASGQKQGEMVLVVPEGKYAVRLGIKGSISQKVKLRKGYFYALTFTYARTCSQEERLNVSVSPAYEPDDSALLPLQTAYTSTGYDTYSWGFLARQEDIQITIHHPDDDDDDLAACGPIVDTVAVNVLRPPRATNANLVKNGNFEEGPFVFHKSNCGVLVPPNIEDKHSPLPAWMIESLKAIKYIDSKHFFVPQGKRAVELLAGRESALSQTIRTTKGKTYYLSFALGDARNGCIGPMQVEAVAAKDKLVVSYHSKGKGGYITANLLFKATKRTTRIRFLSLAYTITMEGSMCGPIIDDVKVIGVRHPPRPAASLNF